MNTTKKSSTLTWSIILLAILIVVTFTLSFYTDNVALEIQRELLEIAHKLPIEAEEMLMDRSFSYHAKLSYISTALLGITILLGVVIGNTIRKHNK